MLPLSRRIAVSANVVFSLYPTRNKVYLILSYLILQHMQSRMCSIFSNGIRGSGEYSKNGTFKNLSTSYRD